MWCVCCVVGVLTGFVMCVCVCMCVCICVGFVMCVCVCMCWFCYVWVGFVTCGSFDNCVGVW